MTFMRKKSQHLNYFAFDKVQLPNPWRISAHCLLMTFFRIFFAPLLHFCRTFVALFPPFEGMIFCATGAPSSNTHTHVLSQCKMPLKASRRKEKINVVGGSRRKGKVKILCERKEKVKIVGESEFVRNNVVDWICSRRADFCWRPLARRCFLSFACFLLYSLHQDGFSKLPG